MVRVRWAGVFFAIVQVLTFYRPYPSGVKEVALALVGALVVGNAILWRLTRLARTATEARHLSIAALTFDTVLILSFVSIYTFDENVAIWALIYILPLEGAIRFRQKGALGIMGIATVAYIGREIYGSLVYGIDVLPTSISFRMGLGLLIAAVSGATAESLFQQRAEVERHVALLQSAYEREHATAEQLREVDAMRVAFLSAVSHELRTPLSVTLGFAKTLEQKFSVLRPEVAKEMISRIATSSEKLMKMLLDLLDMDRLSRGVLEPNRAPTDLKKIVDEVISSVELNGRRVVVDVDPVSAAVDAVQVERVLENLIANALKHTPEDTSVWIRLEKDKDNILLTVEDNGPGVPDQLKDVIFEPFRQGDATHGPGTGIGLSLVAKFAELHGGRAWVEDSPHGGACFRVMLPVTQPSS